MLRAQKQSLCLVKSFQSQGPLLSPHTHIQGRGLAFPSPWLANCKFASRSAQKSVIPEAGCRLLTALCQPCRDIPRLQRYFCSGGLRPLVELCVELAGLCGRCTAVSVPRRVVPSPPGLPSSLSLFTFMHWRRKWQPTPVFLPGESQGRGNLVGCHLWGRKESDSTEQLSLVFLPGES